MLYRQISFLCLLGFMSMHAQAEMYKWVDKDGNVHYSQSKPPDADIKVETIKPPPPPASAEMAQKQLNEREQMLEDLAGERKETAEQQGKAAAEAKEKAAKCQQARERLASYERPRVNMKQADGSMRVLSEEQRQAEIAKSKTYIKELCN